MLQNQFTHLRMILAKNPHYFFGLGRLGESSKAPKIQKDHRDFLPVTSKRIISASSYDQLGKLRGKEALQPTHTLKLCHLLLDALLQSFVPFSELGGLGLNDVVEFLDSKKRLHSHRSEERRVGKGCRSRWSA